MLFVTVAPSALFVAPHRAATRADLTQPDRMTSTYSFAGVVLVGTDSHNCLVGLSCESGIVDTIRISENRQIELDSLEVLVACPRVEHHYPVVRPDSIVSP